MLRSCQGFPLSAINRLSSNCAMRRNCPRSFQQRCGGGHSRKHIWKPSGKKRVILSNLPDGEMNFRNWTPSPRTRHFFKRAKLNRKKHQRAGALLLCCGERERHHLLSIAGVSSAHETNNHKNKPRLMGVQIGAAARLSKSKRRKMPGS